MEAEISQEGLFLLKVFFMGMYREGKEILDFNRASQNGGKLKKEIGGPYSKSCSYLCTIKVSIKFSK